MTDKLVVYGDSTFDTGNLDFLLPPVFGLPTTTPAEPDYVYAAGGFKKASNGYTLLEGFLLGLGVQDIPGPILDLEVIDITFDKVIDPSLPITNFAVAGATTDPFGLFVDAELDLSSAPIGLESQIESSLGYLGQLASFQLNVDVAISIGNNDIFRLAANPSDLAATAKILQSSRREEKALINKTVRDIVDNITGAVKTLKQAGVNEIVVLGPQLTGATPFANSLDQLTGLDFSGLFNKIAIKANTRLDRILNRTIPTNQSMNTPDVYFISGTDINQQFLQTSSPTFIDATHYSSDDAVALGALMATQVQRNSGFQSFGFA
jgi:hypothetical protein